MLNISVGLVVGFELLESSSSSSSPCLLFLGCDCWFWSLFPWYPCVLCGICNGFGIEGVCPADPNPPPKVIGVDPKVIGVDPKVIGVEPNVIGVEPNVIGVDPKVIGVDPNVKGVDPNKLCCETVGAVAANKFWGGATDSEAIGGIGGIGVVVSNWIKASTSTETNWNKWDGGREDAKEANVGEMLINIWLCSAINAWSAWGNEEGSAGVPLDPKVGIVWRCGGKGPIGWTWGVTPGWRGVTPAWDATPGCGVIPPKEGAFVVDVGATSFGWNGINWERSGFGSDWREALFDFISLNKSFSSDFGIGSNFGMISVGIVVEFEEEEEEEEEPPWKRL